MDYDVTVYVRSGEDVAPVRPRPDGRAPRTPRGGSGGVSADPLAGRLLVTYAEGGGTIVTAVCWECGAEATTENAAGPSCMECNRCRCGAQLRGYPCGDGGTFFGCPVCDAERIAELAWECTRFMIVLGTNGRVSAEAVSLSPPPHVATFRTLSHALRLAEKVNADLAARCARRGAPGRR